MDFPSDSSATEAMIQAATNAESAHVKARLSSDWQSTLGDMLIRPSVPQVDVDVCVGKKGEPSRSYNRKGNENSRKDLDEVSFQKFQKPIKTVLPPADIRINSHHLVERINSLQEKALIGHWHFPEMNDSKMRGWLTAQWKPIIGYVPIIAGLLKDWYCFHF